MATNFKGEQWGLSDLATAAVVSIFLVFSCSRGALVDDDVAVRALQDEGYTNIRVEHSSWFMVGLDGCGGQDAAAFKCRAVNTRGDEVNITVCAGWPFKAATVRHP